MTYIEFFDKNALENIGTCLTCAPERVIFLGDSSERMRKSIERYSSIFSARGLQIELHCKTVSRRNLDQAVQTLSQIVETYEDCVFDITGGDELLTLALGIICERYPEKQIRIHRLNLNNNTMYDCDADGVVVCRDVPALSVEELVCAFGGAVSEAGQSGRIWDMNEEFLKDLDRMWQICGKDPRGWNVLTGLLGDIDALGNVSVDGCDVTLSGKTLEKLLQKHRRKQEKIAGLIEALHTCGLLTSESGEDHLMLSYKNTQVKDCLTKAGQVLELKIYAAARNARQNGAAVYNDARTGVVIDWDGDFRDEAADAAGNTENEIDVLLMHNAIPVFISCKNGNVTADELYKLNTVAGRFGGPYAKKVLVATALQGMGKAAQALRQRASDMKIQLIETAQLLDKKTLTVKLSQLWRS